MFEGSHMPLLPLPLHAIIIIGKWPRRIGPTCPFSCYYHHLLRWRTT